MVQAAKCTDNHVGREISKRGRENSKRAVGGEKSVGSLQSWVADSMELDKPTNQNQTHERFDKLTSAQSVSGSVFSEHVEETQLGPHITHKHMDKDTEVGFNLVVDLNRPSECRRRRRRMYSQMFEFQEEINQGVRDGMNSVFEDHIMGGSRPLVENIVSSGALEHNEDAIISEIGDTLNAGREMGMNFFGKEEFLVRRMIEVESQEYSKMKGKDKTK